MSRNPFEALFSKEEEDDESLEDEPGARKMKKRSHNNILASATKKKIIQDPSGSPNSASTLVLDSLQQASRNSIDFKIKILTYNVLAATYCKPAWFPYRTKDELDWRKRRELIKQTILESSSNIVFLQEVQCYVGPEHMRGNDHHIEWFDQWLRTEGGYTGCYASRSNAQGKPLQGVQIGNCLYWKKEEFEPVLVESNVALLKTIATEVRGDKDLRGSFCGTASRGTVACMAALKCLRSQRLIVVVTSHLPAPRSDVDGASKLEQLIHASALMQEVTTFVSRVKDGVDAIVFGGDLNALPNSELMELLTRGCLPRQSVLRMMRLSGRSKAPFIDFATGHLQAPDIVLRQRQAFDKVMNGCYFEDAASMGSNPQTINFTNSTHKFKGRLDYLLCMAAPGAVADVNTSDPSSRLDSAQLLPDEASRNGSDHLPHEAVFCLFARPMSKSREIPLIVTPSLGPVSFDDQDKVESNFVDTEAFLANFCDYVQKLASMNMCLVVDAQGNNLSREGRLSVIAFKYVSLSSADEEPIWILDIVTLKLKTGLEQIKQILEDPSLVKVCFDVRFTSDALFHQLGIKIQNVLDLQVLHQGSRLFQGEELPERTQSWIPHLPSLNKIANSYLSAEVISQFKRPPPFTKQDAAGWTARPLFPLAIEFMACQASLIERLFCKLRQAPLSIEIAQLVETHCRRAVSDFRSRQLPVTPYLDKTDQLGEISIRTAYLANGDAEFLTIWKIRNVLNIVK